MMARCERGAVLVSVLLLLALLGLSTGASLWLTRSELWAAGRARSRMQATYTAEAGIRHALAVLAPAADFALLLERSASALANPSQPGPWPIFGGGAVFFPGPPFGYEIAIVDGRNVAGDAARVVLRSTANAVRGAHHAMTAVVGRSVVPYAPAAVVATTGELAASGIAAPLVIDARTPSAGAQAALGAGSSELAARMSESAERAGAGLLGRRTRVVKPFDVHEFARRSGIVEDDPESLAGGLGSSEAPALAIVRRGTAPSLVGAGLLVASGDLELAGKIDFAGVIAVAGQVVLGGAEPCQVRGMLWARSVVLRGPCALAFDSLAIERADALLRLPRLPVLLALGDE
jgi:hypothetical protein